MDQTIRILLVDDDPEIYPWIQDLLSEVKGLFFKLDWESKSEDAIENLLSSQYHISLIDYQLNGCDGLELINTANDKGCKCPIIVLTGHGDRSIDIKAMKLGVADFLNKYQLNSELLERSIRYTLARKKYKDEIERLLIELTDKNKELEKIIYVASHDIRTPMLNIEGFINEIYKSLIKVSSILKNGVITPEINSKIEFVVYEDIASSVHFIQASVSKINSLLKGLTDLSHLSRNTLDIARLDMNMIISDVLDSFQEIINKKNIKVDIDEMQPCRGDFTSIKQAFINVIDNAVKYLDPRIPGQIKINSYNAKGQVVYCIADNGIGIAEKDINNIFKIFNRINPGETKGNGLGLNIAEKILIQHGGSIKVESDIGKGSIFKLILPMM